MAARLTSLAAVITPDTRLLVLGSMPGAASLAAQQYYAHPRNAFWPIMSQLFNFAADLPYPQRLKQLQAHGIGLWDVLQSCEREGSLDSAIRAETPNDFAALLKQQPQIRALAFNGAKAAQSFRKLVLPTLAPEQVPALMSLPSTSPAHAALHFTNKLQAWQSICQYGIL
jgi:TDG/mug DNA glycosylase family protein